jgi:hypothetical protein
VSAGSVAGTFNDDWGFQIEYDFAENGTSANDVRMSRKLGDGKKVAAGELVAGGAVKAGIVLS